MKGDVDAEVIDEALLCFRRAPGFTKKAVEVSTQHGAGMIERKERIKTDFLELSLARYASSPPFDGRVRREWVVAFQVPGVVGILIR